MGVGVGRFLLFGIDADFMLAFENLNVFSWLCNSFRYQLSSWV